ncbi:MAG: SurA N-terminal domain-containing protein, partial [Acidobacteriota bacterium]
MLQQMRNLFRYLKWILMIIVIMFLWWVFVPGGSAPPASRDSGWAANVNGESISIASFQNVARQLDARYRNLLGDQYEQQRGLIRIGVQAINSLIDEELVHQEALAQGIRVTDRELAEMITKHPSLQENGRFIGIERYQALFRTGQINRNQFEEGFRREL